MRVTAVQSREVGSAGAIALGDGMKKAALEVAPSTREILLASALHLFERNGYPRTSVEDIVDRANLTKGAFYHHFDSKEEVLEIIHNDYVDSQIAMCMQIRAEYADPRDQLRHIARATIANLGTFRSHVSVYLQDRRFLSGDRRRHVQAKRKEIDRVFSAIIDDGVAQGIFRADMSPKLIAFGLIGMYAWVINWWRPDGSLTLEQIADQYVDLILGGLAVAD